MSELSNAITIIGFIISFGGIGVGFYGFATDKDSKIIIPLFISLAVCGLIPAAIGIGMGFDEDHVKQQAIKNQIESMSCTQLHDALLHNTINGTDHVQRATERYVAGCETK